VPGSRGWRWRTWLHRAHDITVFEANAYPGGHTNTIRVDTAYETHHVDTGSIVFNDLNYQNFERLIVPQASAVWSADPRQMWSFPARFVVEFFDNHRMLSFRGRPRWRTIRGGVRSVCGSVDGTVRHAAAAGHAGRCGHAPPRSRARQAARWRG
jgi:predicted NAD/FAD-binding protein